jgi:succinate dehydrogenase / fumarate reductase membrane anchor subunit
MAGYRTALGRARGLGSAKHGVGHFIAERVTSVALIPLVLWAGIVLARGGYDGARAWLASPVNAVLVVLLVVAGFYHMRIGMRVIVEDYIHKPRSKAVLLIANAFLCWAATALTVICLLKVALSGAGA